MSVIKETLQSYIEKSGKSRYQISRETGVNPAILCRLMQNRGIADTNIDILCEYFGLELKPKSRAKK